MDLKSGTGVLSGKGTPSISFSGSGFLAVYQLGVAQCLLDKAPSVLQEAPKIFGSSAGSLVAAAVVCGSSLDVMRDDIVAFVRLAEDHMLGPLHPSINVFKRIEYVARHRLPENAHVLASGRLHISMTRIPDGKNVIVSEFQSREDVVQALLCSCFVPMYCGVTPPCYRGVPYVDGGLTNMQPILNSCKTLTVSPFAWGSDICPYDQPPGAYRLVVSGFMFHLTVNNCIRIIRALYPPSGMVLKDEYQRGYQDALWFLQNSDFLEFKPLKMHGLLVHREDKACPEGRQVNGKSPVLALEESSEVPEDPVQESAGLTNYTGTLAQTWISSLPLLQEAGMQALNASLPSWLEAALLCNLLAQVGTIHSTYVYMRLISYLLLPYTLPIYMIFTFTYRLLMWLSHLPDTVFWQCLRQFALFFVNIKVLMMTKNLEVWVMSTTELQDDKDR